MGCGVGCDRNTGSVRGLKGEMCRAWVEPVWRSREGKCKGKWDASNSALPNPKRSNFGQRGCAQSLSGWFYIRLTFARFLLYPLYLSTMLY